MLDNQMILIILWYAEFTLMFAGFLFTILQPAMAVI